MVEELFPAHGGKLVLVEFTAFRNKARRADSGSAVFSKGCTSKQLTRLFNAFLGGLEILQKLPTRKQNSRSRPAEINH